MCQKHGSDRFLLKAKLFSTSKTMHDPCLPEEGSYIFLKKYKSVQKYEKNFCSCINSVSFLWLTGKSFNSWNKRHIIQKDFCTKMS